MQVFCDGNNVWYCPSKFIIGQQNKELHNVLNNNNRIGNFFKLSTSTFTPTIKQVFHGKDYAICLDYEGNIYGFGFNNLCQLGLYDEVTYNWNSNCEGPIFFLPRKIEMNEPIREIYCGSTFTICVGNSGKIYFFGNSSSEDGFGCNNLQYAAPEIMNIPDNEEVDFIYCGNEEAIIKTIDNKFYRFDFDFLRFNDSLKILKWKFPNNVISMCNDGKVLLTKDGSAYCAIQGRIGEFMKIAGLPKIEKIIYEYENIFCIDQNYDLWSCYYEGNRRYNIFCISHKYTNLSNIVEISGQNGTIYVKTFDGYIFAFGNNDNGQIIPNGKKFYNYHEAIRIFKENENIWKTTNHQNKMKSARK